MLSARRIPVCLRSWCKKAFLNGRLDQFDGYQEVRREVTFEESRFDLMLSGEERTCYVETKSVNLVENRVALFPDAPTERGRKHLGTLVKAVNAGHRAAAFFVVQRADADGLPSPPHRGPRLRTSPPCRCCSGGGGIRLQLPRSPVMRHRNHTTEFRCGWNERGFR